MKALIIINDPPYGTERLYNGLRLANALLKQQNNVTVFLMADAVVGAKSGQKTPEGFYNIGLMLKRVAANGDVLLCGTCMDARGIKGDDIIEGARRSTMDELADMTVSADKVMVF